MCSLQAPPPLRATCHAATRHTTRAGALASAFYNILCCCCVWPRARDAGCDTNATPTYLVSPRLALDSATPLSVRLPTARRVPPRRAFRCLPLQLTAPAHGGRRRCMAVGSRFPAPRHTPSLPRIPSGLRHPARALAFTCTCWSWGAARRRAAGSRPTPLAAAARRRRAPSPRARRAWAAWRGRWGRCGAWRATRAGSRRGRCARTAVSPAGAEASRVGREASGELRARAERGWASAPHRDCRRDELLHAHRARCPVVAALCMDPHLAQLLIGRAAGAGARTGRLHCSTEPRAVFGPNHRRR